MTINTWRDLKYWSSGEWQVVEEKLDDYERNELSVSPERSTLFRALREVPFHRCNVCIVGQDPYPKSGCATGVAFSVPKSLEVRDFPPTLRNVFAEYTKDLGYPAPTSGDLTPWCQQGVLLWNAYPSCEVGKPGSHHWDEWSYLTKEIIHELDSKEGLVYVFLGSVARSFNNIVNNNPVIETSHPSPLGAKYGFLGSSIFTRTNEMLLSRSLPPIDWRLP